MKERAVLRRQGVWPLDNALRGRLARALGLSGLAGLCMASGPCGECTPEEHACFDIPDLTHQRAMGLVQTSAVGGVTAGGASGSDSDEAAGNSPASFGGHPFGGRPSSTFDTNVYDRQTAASWDPTSGCPTADQFNAILRLNSYPGHHWDALESNTDGRCCYKTFAKCYGGRPFLVNGSARVATLATSEPALLEPASGSFEHCVRQSWLADALMEHASVASFARLTLQLLAFGAPQELVADSQRASLDELRHARFCFEQAQRGQPGVLAARQLRMDDALGAQPFAEFVRCNLIEGCIGETLASVRLSEQARRAKDPAVRAGLAAIAEDEGCHAELAFRILRWCLELKPAVTRIVLARVMNQGLGVPPRGPTSTDPRWSDEGRLSDTEGAQLDHQTWQTTLAPVFREALSSARAEQDESGPTSGESPRSMDRDCLPYAPHER